MQADQVLDAAKALIGEHGETYDAKGGERSVAPTVQALNALTGQDLTEAQGWLFLLLLKQRRLFTAPGFHQDSGIDAAAYAALTAEAKAKAKAKEALGK
jgi:hypothetical protein